MVAFRLLRGLLALPAHSAFSPVYFPGGRSQGVTYQRMLLTAQTLRTEKKELHSMAHGYSSSDDGSGNMVPSRQGKTRSRKRVVCALHANRKPPVSTNTQRPPGVQLLPIHTYTGKQQNGDEEGWCRQEVPNLSAVRKKKKKAAAQVARQATGIYTVFSFRFVVLVILLVAAC